MKPVEPPWPFVTVALLGIWLMASPATLGYGGPMLWSDLLSGVATFIIGLLAIRPKHRWWSRWILATAGLWLLFAPLIFETPDAAAYLNSTVIGTLLIALTLVVPRGLSGTRKKHPDTPPGWTYNPSSWLQRAPIVVLALINFLLARYLAAYQLGHFDHVWDPVFDEGTHNVLKSDISEAFPISDAGLGAVAYMVEALIGCIGNAARWRTAPWAVALFGVLVVPVGVVSLVLIMLQPVAVGDWCLICLITATLMLLMALLALPEVAALCWFLWRTWRNKKPFWRTFIFGDEVTDATDERTFTAENPLPDLVRAMVSGATLPWSLLVCVLGGAWLMAVPEILTMQRLPGDAHSIAGALIITVSVLAMAEPARALRLVNLPLALLFIITLITSEAAMGEVIHGTAIAAFIIALSLPRGTLRQSHGAWQRLVV